MTAGASQNINPSRIAPDPIAIESATRLGSKIDYSPNTGAKASGMADTTISGASTFGRAAQSATDSVRSASSTASQILSSSVQQTSRSGALSSNSNSILNSLANSKREGLAENNSKQILLLIGHLQVVKSAIVKDCNSPDA